MRYNSLIKNSIKVSEIGFGAWQLGVESGWQQLSDKESFELVRYAWDAGINFFDTAPNYGFGTGEERLGKALKELDRSKIVINTKFGHTHTGTMNYESGYIRTSLEGSLRRLQTDYVDSLIIHNPPSEYLDGNTNDHYEILERLKDEGKIRAYGASLDTAHEMKLLMETTGSEVIEAFFNIFHQDAANAFGLAKESGVGIIVKIPLDSGWLTGKYNEHSVFEGVRSRWSRSDIQTRAQLVSKLKEITGDQRSLSSTALAFCLAFDAVSTVIPGNISIQQLQENIRSAETRLPDTIKKELREFYSSEIAHLNLPW